MSNGVYAVGRVLSESERRRGQGYDQHPPMCGRCMHLAVRRAADYFPPSKLKGNGRTLVCAFGDFTTTRTAVCDRWTSKDGKEVVA